MELIKAASGASKTSFELIENLLHWARSQFNSIQVRPSEFDIVPIIISTYQLNESQLAAKKIEGTISAPPQAIVWADVEMIKTVLHNVLSNAIKFTPLNGQINILVETKEQSVTISVVDTGVGIEKERLQSLFKTSENQSTNGTHGEKGTGLGLVLSYDFIQKNNGDFWIDSTLGQGTTIHFSLPIANKLK